MHAVRLLLSWYFCELMRVTPHHVFGQALQADMHAALYMPPVHRLSYIMRHVTARTAAATRMASGSARSMLGALLAPELYSWLVCVGGSAAGVTEMLKLKRHDLA